MSNTDPLIQLVLIIAIFVSLIPPA